MFGRKPTPRKQYTNADQRGVFHDSMRRSNEAWKDYLRMQGACKERIIFDERDGLPVNYISIRRNVPFLRYSFSSLRRVEKALKSMSFIVRPQHSYELIILKALEIGYYYNEVSHRWELLVWGADLDRELIQECEAGFQRVGGAWISSCLPEAGERDRIDLSGLIVQKAEGTLSPVVKTEEAGDDEFEYTGMEPPLSDIRRVLAGLDRAAAIGESPVVNPEAQENRALERRSAEEQQGVSGPIVSFGNYRVNGTGFSGSYGSDIQFSGTFKDWDFKNALRSNTYRKY